MRMHICGSNCHTSKPVVVRAGRDVRTFHDQVEAGRRRAFVESIFSTPLSGSRVSARTRGSVAHARRRLSSVGAIIVHARLGGGGPSIAREWANGQAAGRALLSGRYRPRRALGRGGACSAAFVWVATCRRDARAPRKRAERFSAAFALVATCGRDARAPRPRLRRGCRLRRRFWLGCARSSRRRLCGARRAGGTPAHPGSAPGLAGGGGVRYGGGRG